MSYQQYSSGVQNNQHHSSAHSAHHSSSSMAHGYSMHPQAPSTPVAGASYYSQQAGYSQSNQIHPDSSLSSTSLRPLPFSRGYPVPSNAGPSDPSHVMHAPQPSYAAQGQAAAYPGYSQTSHSSMYHYAQGSQALAQTHTSPVPPNYRPGSAAPRSSAVTTQYTSGSHPSSTERYECPHCKKTFSRNFDRKRHMEIHVPGSSGNNRCQYCHKDYSRADSLKRHLDNGCDMKP